MTRLALCAIHKPHPINGYPQGEPMPNTVTLAKYYQCNGDSKNGDQICHLAEIDRPSNTYQRKEQGKRDCRYNPVEGYQAIDQRDIYPQRVPLP